MYPRGVKYGVPVDRHPPEDGHMVLDRKDGNPRQGLVGAGGMGVRIQKTDPNPLESSLETHMYPRGVTRIRIGILKTLGYGILTM